jgi:hypothetical protein
MCSGLRPHGQRILRPIGCCCIRWCRSSFAGGSRALWLRAGASACWSDAKRRQHAAFVFKGGHLKYKTSGARRRSLVTNHGPGSKADGNGAAVVLPLSATLRSNVY